MTTTWKTDVTVDPKKGKAKEIRNILWDEGFVDVRMSKGESGQIYQVIGKWEGSGSYDWERLGIDELREKLKDKIEEGTFRAKEVELASVPYPDDVKVDLKTGEAFVRSTEQIKARKKLEEV